MMTRFAYRHDIQGSISEIAVGMVILCCDPTARNAGSLRGLGQSTVVDGDPYPSSSVDLRSVVSSVSAACLLVFRRTKVSLRGCLTFFRTQVAGYSDASQWNRSRCLVVSQHFFSSALFTTSLVSIPRLRLPIELRERLEQLTFSAGLHGLSLPERAG